jgi:hypothetical protein
MAPITEAYLAQPVGYVAMAPFSNVFDTLVLLSVRQHIAIFVGLIAVFVLSRVATSAARHAGWRRHLRAVAVFFVAFVLTYVAAVLLPRPMAYLASLDPNIIRIDFHSHTSASGDARDGFSPERNRAWHRRGGYDVAYIADHGTVAGAERGMADNPPAGLDAPVLLQGIEATWTGEHVGILNAQRAYRGVLTENLRDVDPQGLQLASVVATREPVVIWHHPRDLGRLPPAAGPMTTGIRALEVSNGAPDNMDDVRPKRAQIVALAREQNLALTTGTDNHGWGYTAPNWTLMRPRNWRGLSGDELALRIERVIRDGGYGGTRVVERVVADPGGNPIALGLTVITVPWRMFTTLSTDERVMWLVWTWAIALVLWWRRRRSAAA